MKQHTPINSINNLIASLPDFKNCEIVPTFGGVSTDVYKLIKNDSVFYLRIAEPEEGMSAEVLAYQKMLEKGISVPKVLTHEDFNQKINRSYMITSEIKGVSLDQSTNGLTQVLFKAGQDLAKINSIEVNGFGWPDRKVPDVKTITGACQSWEAFALDMRQMKKMLTDLQKADILTQNIINRCISYIEKNKNLISCQRAYLAHGDFGLEHIFHTDGNYTGIIDFGDILASSMYQDLSHFYTYHPDNFSDLLNGYADVKPLENGYMEKIEFLALLFVLRKLWWVLHNRPETLQNRKRAFLLIEKVLK